MNNPKVGGSDSGKVRKWGADYLPPIA